MQKLNSYKIVFMSQFLCLRGLEGVFGGKESIQNVFRTIRAVK